MNVDDCSRCVHYRLTIRDKKVVYLCWLQKLSVFDVKTCPEGVQLPLIDGVPERWGIPREEVKI
jgi:hypothetical protein